jgi:hypothetical protein
MMKVSTLLIRSRDLIVKGWTRETGERDGRYCSLGAIGKVRSSPSVTYEAYTQARGLLATVVGVDRTIETEFDAIVRFNDRQKTKKPVVEAFNRAIELAKVLGI